MKTAFVKFAGSALWCPALIVACNSSSKEDSLPSEGILSHILYLTKVLKKGRPISYAATWILQD